MDRNWRNFDLPAWLATLALIILGGVMIYSAYEASQPAPKLIENLVFRQGLFALIGMGLYFLFAYLDYHLLIRLHRWIYLFVIFILTLTLALGQIFFGARSWFEVHAFTIQPSELCKVLMIVVLAKYLGDEKANLESPVPLLTTLLLVLPPAILIYRQSDFGTALILVCIWLGMCLLAGVRWRHIALLAGAGVAAVPIIWFQLKGYMRDRILMFLLPDYDPSGASYNINQALISIGSGGFWGKGLLRGTQSQLHFLRVRHTDFIFSVLAEELGFVGAMFLLGLFAFLILRLVRAATLARDSYGQLIVGGVATMVAVQTLINLGMNANLLPVTGLPLPLVSYGGSSLITMLLALGLAQSVILRHKPASLPLP